ncbi:unnamed protein product [Calypogeia fissa]
MHEGPESPLLRSAWKIFSNTGSKRLLEVDTSAILYIPEEPACEPSPSGPLPPLPLGSTAGWISPAAWNAQEF